MIETKATNNPEILDKLDKDLQSSDADSIEAQYNATRKTAVWAGASVGGVTFLLLLVALGILWQASAGAKGWALGAIIGAVAGLILGFSAQAFVMKRVKGKVQTAILPLVIHSVLGKDVTYLTSTNFDRTFLKDLWAFPVNSLEPKEMLYGTYAGVPFIAADVTSYHYESRSNGKSTYQERVNDFVGTVFVYRFNKPSNAVILAREKGFMSLDFSRPLKEKFESESIQFNDTYDTYVNDLQSAFYVLTPQNILGLLDIQSLAQGKMTVIIDKRAIAIVVRGATGPLTDSIKGKLDKDDIHAIANRLVPIKAFAETLNLNNSYWTDIQKAQAFDAKDLYASLAQGKGRSRKQDDSLFSYLIRQTGEHQS